MIIGKLFPEGKQKRSPRSPKARELLSSRQPPCAVCEELSPSAEAFIGEVISELFATSLKSPSVKSTAHSFTARCLQGCPWHLLAHSPLTLRELLGRQVLVSPTSLINAARQPNDGTAKKQITAAPFLCSALGPLPFYFQDNLWDFLFAVKCKAPAWCTTALILRWAARHRVPK